MPSAQQQNYKIVLLGEGKHSHHPHPSPPLRGRLCGQELHRVAVRGGQVQLLSPVHFTGVYSSQPPTLPWGETRTRHNVEFFNFSPHLNRPLKIYSFENISENNTLPFTLQF